MRAIEYLKENQAGTAEKWREEAEYRRKNSRWLLYSAMISLQVKHRMKEMGITQVVLAEKLNCTQQHVSIMLKGTANLTLETISKIETALDIDIIGGALIPVDGYNQSCTYAKSQYLTDGDEPIYGNGKDK